MSVTPRAANMSRRPTPRPAGSEDDTAADAITAAEALVPRIRAAREECERLRHLPPAMAEALANAGFLQMYVPGALGGPELSPLAAFRVVETLSRADGSIGWCSMIATSISDYVGWLPPDGARAMVGEPADWRLAGSIRPLGLGYSRAGRLPRQRPLAFRQWHSSRELAHLHQQDHGW